MNDNLKDVLLYIGEYKEKGSEIIPSYCPFCGGGIHRDKGTFAINKETGAYNCKRGTCGESGSIKQLCEYLNVDFKKSNEYFREYRKPKKIYKKPEPKEGELTEDIIEYFKLRGISKGTLLKNKVSTHKGNIAFNYYENGELVFIKYKIPRKQRIINGKKETKSWRENDGKPILYGMDDCVIGKPLIIVEGEPDKLVLDECRIQNAVSVPSGTQDLEWIELCWEFLEKFQEIIIWSDNDPAGKGMQQDLLARLEDWKLKVVKCEEKDANVLLFKKGEKAVADAIQKAVPITKEFMTCLADVKRKNYRVQTPISTGYEELDNLLGGMYGGMLCVWSGYNGSGKSTMLSNIMLNGIELGIKTFAYSGELPREDFKEWVDLQASGPNHIDFYDCGVKKSRIPIPNEKYFKALDEYYSDLLFLYDSDDYATDIELFKAMEYMVKREGCKVFIIDNLMTIEVNERGEINEKQSRMIKKFKTFARKYNVIVHLVAHPKKPQFGQTKMTKYDVSGTADITNLADRVFGFHKLTEKEKAEDEEYSSWSNVLSVYKDRKFGIFDQEVKFRFNFFSKRYYTNNEELNKDYSWVKDKKEEVLDYDKCPF